MRKEKLVLAAVTMLIIIFTTSPRADAYLIQWGGWDYFDNEAYYFAPVTANTLEWTGQGNANGLNPDDGFYHSDGQTRTFTMGILDTSEIWTTVWSDTYSGAANKNLSVSLGTVTFATASIRGLRFLVNDPGNQPYQAYGKLRHDYFSLTTTARYLRYLNPQPSPS